MNNPHLTEYARTNLPTEFGSFVVRAFRDPDGVEHLAISSGVIEETPVVRIHSECLTGEVLLSLKCDCRGQLTEALKQIAKEGGVVVYLRQEGRGIGLGNKLRAYALQEQGHDTLDANVELGFAPDERSYESAVEILRQLGVKRLRLLTNNPEKVAALRHGGLDIVERLSIVVPENPHSAGYLQTKRERFGHEIE